VDFPASLRIPALPHLGVSQFTREQMDTALTIIEDVIAKGLRA